MRQIIPMAVAAALLTASPVSADPETLGLFMHSVPRGTVTVMGLYKQDVYDPSEKKIGQITDILVGREGEIAAFVISAGEFVGLKKHDVIVPMQHVRVTRNGGKDYLMMDVTRDEMKGAKAFQYDAKSMSWKPDEADRSNARSTDSDRAKARSFADPRKR